MLWNCARSSTIGQFNTSMETIKKVKRPLTAIWIRRIRNYGVDVGLALTLNAIFYEIMFVNHLTIMCFMLGRDPLLL